MLLDELPVTTVRKYPPEQLRTSQGRAYALAQLVTKHSGEVVELDPKKPHWCLLDCN